MIGGRMPDAPRKVVLAIERWSVRMTFTCPYCILALVQYREDYRCPRCLTAFDVEFHKEGGR